MNIELASETDLDHILALQRKAFHGQALIYNDFALPSLTQTIADLRTEFKDKTFYKVEENGRIIASVRCFIFDQTLYIEKLIVDPDSQNKGIGTAIMREIESRYSPVVNRYELSTGHKSARNLHLYKKLGYKELRQEPLNDNCNLIVLGKSADKKGFIAIGEVLHSPGTSQGQVHTVGLFLKLLLNSILMARPLRIEYPGAVYHITNRGNDKKAVFKDDTDRETFLKILAFVNKRYHWICHAYCLMDNHYHLMIETPDGNLSLGMRQLNGVYTQARNKRYNKTGHLFQGRYKAILIQKDTHLLEVCRYVVLNPVRAGMVEKPEDWRWSSYRATAGKEAAHSCLTADWVLGQFSRTRGTAEKEYRQFVKWGIGKETVWGEVKGQALLGEDDFVDSLADYLKRHKDIPEIPKSQRYANRPALEKIFNQGMLGDKPKRDRKIAEAVEKYGYTQRSIADHLGVHATYVSRILCGHYKR